jgi:alpha-D-xyloside xylohydrolase
MKQNIDWKSIAEPLDVTNVYAPRHYIRSWLSFQKIETGVIFNCEMANGEFLDYHVDVIAAEVFRMRMNPQGVIECGSDMLVRCDFPASPFTIIENDDVLIISTERIRIEFPRTWQVTAYDDPTPGKGHIFYQESTDDRAYGPGFEVPPTGFEVSEAGDYFVRQSVAIRPGESFYGLGEKFTSLDKWKHEIPLWAVDSGNVSTSRSYKNVPLLLCSSGYALFIHSSYPMLFRMGSESSVSYSIHLRDSQLDMFLIYGPSYKHILKRYSELTGFAPIPPKWSFGFWISRAGYRSRKEVEDIITEMRRRGFPCDVLHLDPWWMGEGPWCHYTWDENKFPKPDEMMSWMRDQGVRTCLWIHPYVPKSNPLFEEGKALGVFVKDKNGEVCNVMEAFTSDSEGLAAVDFTNPAACEWWQGKLEKLVDLGTAVFKTDFGEQAPIEGLYHDGRNGLEMHNLYPLLYNRTAFELTKRKFGRGLVWGRSAYAGSQRYPVQWGGDSYSTLNQLACQVRGMLGYGLSGVPFSSHDVGGFDYSPHFFDDCYHIDFNESYKEEVKDSYPKDEVVYARWMQVGVFSSHVRAHGKQAREPWTFGEEVEQISLKYLKLRYRLLPYIYTQAVLSTRTGIPMTRPMLLEFQDDPTTQRIDLQYMFGDSFLVAPVLTRDGRTQVYLPAGNWVDYWTKEIQSGPVWVTMDVPLDTLPLWVRGGEIIPMGPEMDYVEQKTFDPLTIEIYSPEGERKILIEDEDKEPIEVRYHRSGQHLEVWVGKAPGRVELVLIGEKVKAAWQNEKALDLESQPFGIRVSFDGRSGGVVVFELESKA